MREPWIASIQVEPDGEISILGDQHSAITQVVAAVADQNEMEHVISEWIELVGLRLVSMIAAEPVRTYRQHAIPDDDVERMIESTINDPDGVHIGDFETPSPKLVQ